MNNIEFNHPLLNRDGTKLVPIRQCVPPETDHGCLLERSSDAQVWQWIVHAHGLDCNSVQELFDRYDGWEHRCGECMVRIPHERPRTHGLCERCNQRQNGAA